MSAYMCMQRFTNSAEIGDYLQIGVISLVCDSWKFILVFLRNGVKEWQGSRHEIFHADNEALNDFVFASELFKKVKGAAR